MNEKMKYSTTEVTLTPVPVFDTKGSGHRNASVPKQTTVPYDDVLLLC